jgi:hypothetical protein
LKESAAEKAATQRNGTEKERNAPTEHQAKREKRLKAADGNGADGNGDGTSSSTRKSEFQAILPIHFSISYKRY